MWISRESLLGVAVQAGTSGPDVSTVEAFKQVPLRAKAVAMPARLGMVGMKMAPRGTDATRMVAAGELDLAVHAVGVEFAGSIAPMSSCGTNATPSD